MADAIQISPNTKNDLIVAAVQKNLIEKAVLAPTVRDVSQFAIDGAKSFLVPKLSNFTVVNRAFGSNADAETLTDSTDTIQLNFNAYIAWLYDSRSITQSTVKFQAAAAERASMQHAKYVDEQIVATLSSVADIEVSAADASTADVKSQILAMRAALLNNGAEISRMTLAINPDKEAEMLAVQDFVRADFYGSANVRTGQIGQIYGIPVVISRLVTVADEDMYMYDADGVGLAFQGGVEMTEQMANEYGANSRRVAMDQVFGVGGLELEEQGAAAGKSPLVAKLTA